MAQPVFEKCAAYFSKEAKAAPLQLRSPPAEEAKAMILKELPKEAISMESFKHANSRALRKRNANKLRQDSAVIQRTINTEHTLKILTIINFIACFFYPS